MRACWRKWRGRWDDRLDAHDYAQEAATIAVAFNQRFLVAGTGRYDTATQACQAMALQYGLVPPSEEAAAMEVLAQDVAQTHGGHLTTGIFGTPALLSALSEGGHADVAYTVASQQTFPGWGWMLANGATTLWEHWEFSDNTFSHNHPMFGSISAWFQKSLAGICVEPDAVGFDKIRIQPRIVGDLTWARGSYRSVRGLAISEWRKQGGVLYLSIVVPPNTSATVYVPAAPGTGCTGGKRSGPEGVRRLLCAHGSRLGGISRWVRGIHISGLKRALILN